MHVERSKNEGGRQNTAAQHITTIPSTLLKFYINFVATLWIGRAGTSCIDGSVSCRDTYYYDVCLLQQIHVVATKSIHVNTIVQ
jgi:hypothetical protein